MTEIQKQQLQIKQLKIKLDVAYKKLSKRIENYDREERQLFLLQKNIENIQDLTEELLVAIENQPLRKKVVKF